MRPISGYQVCLLVLVGNPTSGREREAPLTNEVGPDRLEVQGDALTVVRGCLATVLEHWDALPTVQRTELLKMALENAEKLVEIHEADAISIDPA